MLNLWLQLLLSYWWFWILVLLVLIYRLFKPAIKGYIGEKTIGISLSRLDSDQYKVLNDVMVDTGDKTSQIDHLVISQYGIFVIETKNYKGWIIGDENSQNWVQIIYKRKKKFYNPIRQNYGHVEALKAVLQDIPDLKFIPIVVFSPNAELKVSTLNSTVIYSTHLLRTIRGATEVVISQQVRDEVFQRLASSNITDRAARQRHVQDIRKITSPGFLCPRCGLPLKLRDGKTGPFKGCSGFPRCRFTAPA